MFVEEPTGRQSAHAAHLTITMPVHPPSLGKSALSVLCSVHEVPVGRTSTASGLGRATRNEVEIQNRFNPIEESEEEEEMPCPLVDSDSEEEEESKNNRGDPADSDDSDDEDLMELLKQSVGQVWKVARSKRSKRLPKKKRAKEQCSGECCKMVSGDTCAVIPHSGLGKGDTRHKPRSPVQELSLIHI